MKTVLFVTSQTIVVHVLQFGSKVANLAFLKPDFKVLASFEHVFSF